MSSIYHILNKVPQTDPNEIQVEYEHLAQSLVNSGRLRIDTDHHCNFARFTDPQSNLSLMVSKEELFDEKLIPNTKENFKKLYAGKLRGAAFDKKLAFIFDTLKKQINKLQPVNPLVTIKLARIFVQSAHPIVIKWLLHDNVEVYITYSHNIGDMMDMQGWQQSGSNSGMQSTDGRNAAVFVSCGGDPFAENNKDHPTIGDGWAAVARLQIIAGQELGHFADIKRDERGRQITRHSANFSATKATEHTKIARKNDLKRCDELFSILLLNGMDKLINYEEKLRFYHKNKITGVRVLVLKFLQFIYKQKLLIYSKKHKLLFVAQFANDKYMSLMIRAMIEDMKFNLNPIADVYTRSDKDAEEAIKCVEALARVPQQVMKWGYLTTMEAMKDLYKIYYQEVIPSLISNYSTMTGITYKRNYHKPPKSFNKITRILKKEKNTFTPVRDL